MRYNTIYDPNLSDLCCRCRLFTCKEWSRNTPWPGMLWVLRILITFPLSISLGFWVA